MQDLIIQMNCSSVLLMANVEGDIHLLREERMISLKVLMRMSIILTYVVKVVCKFIFPKTLTVLP